MSSDLAVARHLPAGRHRAGDRHLKIHDYRDNLNTDPKPFIWTKTADEILVKLARYCAAVTATEYHGAPT